MLRSKISKYAKGAPSLRPTFCVWKKSCSVVPSGSTETFFRTPKDKRSLPYEWSSGHLYQEKHPEQPGGLAPVASQTNLIGFAWRNSNMAVCHWNWKLLFCRRTTAVQWLDWTYHISVIQPPLAPSCAMRQCDISPAFLTPQGAAPTWFHRNPQAAWWENPHPHPQLGVAGGDLPSLAFRRTWTVRAKPINKISCIAKSSISVRKSFGRTEAGAKNGFRSTVFRQNSLHSRRAYMSRIWCRISWNANRPSSLCSLP